MGTFATPWWGQALAWAAAAVIVALNAKLILDQVFSWIGMAAESGLSVGPLPLSWLVGGVLAAATGSIAALLFWVTVKPIIRPSAAWGPPASVPLDLEAAFRPHSLARIGVALEHGQADAEILNRAISLAQADGGHPELLLLHVVDTPVTRVLGSETADRETDADARYLAELVRALRERGYRSRSVLLHGPDPAGQLVSHLRGDPVDLLVVGSHGHGLVRDLLFGQTVDRVRHNLGVPMLIARPGKSPASGLSAAHDAAPARASDDLDSGRGKDL
jgi:manganese transport protein